MTFTSSVVVSTAILILLTFAMRTLSRVYRVALAALLVVGLGTVWFVGSQSDGRDLKALLAGSVVAVIANRAMRRTLFHQRRFEGSSGERLSNRDATLFIVTLILTTWIVASPMYLAGGAASLAKKNVQP